MKKLFFFARYIITLTTIFSCSVNTNKLSTKKLPLDIQLYKKKWREIIPGPYNTLNLIPKEKPSSWVPSLPRPYKINFEEYLVPGYIRKTEKTIFNNNSYYIPLVIKKLIQNYYRQKLIEDTSQYTDVRSQWFQLYETKDVEAVKKFLSTYAIDLNLKNHNNMTLLMLCIYEKKNIPVALYLIELSKSHLTIADYRNNTALHYSAYYNCPRVIKSLLKVSSIEEINKKNDDDETAIHICIYKKSKQALRALLSSNNIDLTIPCEHITPIMISNKIDINKLILEKETNINNQNMFGNTIAHLVLLGKYCDYFAEMVLTHKDLDPNIQNNKGYTILHILIIKQKASLLKKVLKHFSSNTKKKLIQI